MLELKGKEQWYSKLFRMINSGVCFSIAYIILTYLHWVVMALVGNVFKFDAFVYYFGIKFILVNEIWTRFKVTFIYSSAPLFLLVAGLFGLYFYSRLKKFPTLLNVLFLWFFVIGSGMFCAQGVISCLGAGEYNSPYYQGFTVVYAWWRIPEAGVYLLSIPFSVLLIYFSANYGRLFLIFAYSYTKVNKLNRRRKYFIEVAMVPYLIGCLITSVVTFPMNIFVHAVYLLTIGIALVLAWLTLFYIEIMKDDVVKYKSLQSLSFGYIILLGTIIGFVMLTWRGIYLSFS